MTKETSEPEFNYTPLTMEGLAVELLALCELNIQLNAWALVVAGAAGSPDISSVTQLEWSNEAQRALLSKIGGVILGMLKAPEIVFRPGAPPPSAEVLH